MNPPPPKRFILGLLVLIAATTAAHFIDLTEYAVPVVAVLAVLKARHWWLSMKDGGSDD